MDSAGRIEIIRELCSFAPRLAGTDAERRAANRMAERLRELGRRAEAEPTFVHPQYSLVYAAHCALAVAASLAAGAAPVVSFAVALLAATSLYLDLNTRLYLLRRLFFRRGSQNVVSPGLSPDAPARVLICAHLDAARGGAAFSPRANRMFAALSRLARFPVTAPRVTFWSLALLIPLLGVRAAGIDSVAVSILQLPPTLALLVAVFALVDIQLSSAVPGANDNASGVATALSLAAELERDRPENLDVWVVLTGGEECAAQGMRSFVRAHRKRLDRAATYVLNLNSVGAGDVRFEVGEGATLTYELGSRLTELCAAVAQADREGDNRFRATPLRHGFATDALPPRLARIPSTTLTCLEPGALVPANHHRPADVPEAIDPEALDRAHGFALALVRALDRDVARRSGAAPRATAQETA